MARTRTKHQQALAAAIGIFSGTLVHILFAVIGLSALLASSAIAFSVIKWAGAAYLVYLGVRMLVSQPAARTATRAAVRHANVDTSIPTASTVFRRGIFINLLNPKIALFFLAFLPQFIDQNASHEAVALAVLGLVFNLTGTLINAGVAVVSARASRSRPARRLGGLFQRLAGATFVGLGLRLAVADPH